MLSAGPRASAVSGRKIQMNPNIELTLYVMKPVVTYIVITFAVLSGATVVRYAFHAVRARR